MMRCLALLAAALVIGGGDAAFAQPAEQAAAAAAEEHIWDFAAAATIYMLPEDQNYVQPTVRVDHDWLHLEARHNYEDLKTGSVWLGVNFGGGDTFEWAFTPMVGGVFGSTAGIAPGFEGSLSWRGLELYEEGEYVVNANERSESFFYNWSEVTFAPVEWFKFGMVTQRTHAYRSDREVERGIMAGVSFRHVNLTGYVFNPDDDPGYVIAVEWHR